MPEKLDTESFMFSGIGGAPPTHRKPVNLATPIWLLSDDAKNFAAFAEKTEDPEGKQTFRDRAEQCALAVKILENYAKLA